jgi:acetyl esterase/lipase
VSRLRLARDLLAWQRSIAYGPAHAQRGDLYLPPGPGPHPVVVALHGGGWQLHYTKVLMKGLAGDLVRRGFAVWNLEYRRMGNGGGVPATLEDVAAGIDRLASLPDRLDLRHVTAVGHSAGGQLALWAAGRVNVPPGAPGAVPRVRLGAVASLAGVADMTASAGSPGLARRFMGGTAEEHPERYAHGDPMRLLPYGIPMLLVHGEEDDVVPLRRSRGFAEAARAAGDEDVEFVALPGPAGAHSAYLDPGGEAWAVVVRWLARLRARAAR